MPAPPRARPGAVLAVILAAAAGCSGPNDGRLAVSGSVKLRDQPLEAGVVMFEPLDGQDTGASAMLTGGGYAIPREYGLKAGRYRVRVTAGDGKTAVNPVDGDEPPGPGGGTNIVSKDLIPPAWGRQSKQEVTVRPDGPNTFDLDVK